MAKRNRPVAAEREADSWPVALPRIGPLARDDTGLLRYCCSSTSMEAGKPSMIHDRWLSFPSAPTADVTRDLKAGSRYFSKRSPGSWICISLSTNLSPSFMASSVYRYHRVKNSWQLQFREPLS